MTGGNGLRFGAAQLHTLRRAATTTTAAIAAAVLGAALIAASPAAGPASAASPPDGQERQARTPEVHLEIPIQDVDAGAPFQVRVKSHGVGRAKVFLQRRPAGSRTWMKVLRVGKRGLFTAPGVSIGTYTYRLIVKRHGKILARSNGRQLRSYDNITLQQYCGGAGVTVFSCASGSVQVGGAPFAYHAVASKVGTGPEAEPSAEFKNSSCRRITLTYAVSDASVGVTSAAVSLTQDKGGAPQVSTVPAGTIGAASFVNGSKGWNLRFWTTPTAVPVYWDATLNCFTSSGFRK